MGDILMRVWITNVGRQTYAVINPIWMWLLEGYDPIDTVVLIYNEKVKHEKEIIKKKLEILFSYYKVNVSIKFEESAEEWSKYWLNFIDIMKKYAVDADEVILDLTPGRKFMSVAAFLAYNALRKKGLNIKMVYLHLLDLSYQQRPLSTIPLPLQKFIVRGEQN